MTRLFLILVLAVGLSGCSVLKERFAFLFRKSDAKTFDFILGMGKKELGIAPEDVKSVVAFVPVLKGSQDTERFAVVLTFHKAFDASKLQAGAEKLLPKDANPKVLAPDARTALVLLNLKEEDVKPQVNWKEGPLAGALKDAASGKFAASRFSSKSKVMVTKGSFRPRASISAGSKHSPSSPATGMRHSSMP